MKLKVILTGIISLLLCIGCATYVPKYAKGEPESDFGYPSEKSIARSFYLIGDGGYSLPGGSSEGLLALEAYLDSVQQKENFTLFLGDNIYPDGLVSKNDPKRERAEGRLDAQINAVKNYGGNIIFIPGNHDWYNEGIAGLKRQEDYLQENLGEKDVFQPKPGCPLKFIDISDEVHLIIMDSQWYLTDWDDHPTINDDCPGIKTREQMFTEIETELKKNQNKTTVFAIHHPLRSNGIHGGQYNFNEHLYPSHKKIPFPILGSIAMLVRTSGGISIQDMQNERYKSMINRLETIAAQWGNVVFASGHEHSLQYIEEENIKQIVAGSGSKTTYAGLRNNGLFAYAGQGFAVFDVFEDGSSWVSYYGSKNNKPVLLYQKEVFSEPEKYPVDTLPTTFPETVEASVYEPEKRKEGDLYTTIWGEGYRDLYFKEIKVPVVNLDTLYGGLKPMRKGGGHQSVTLRLKDSLGREYNLRRLKKDAVQFIQAVAFKEQIVYDQFQNTLPEKILQDFYTASHPYAFLAIPPLARAAGVLHTNPELFYVPKQPALEKYNFDYGDELYMIEERPEESWLEYKSFGAPNHDIVSTEGMFERLRRDENYSIHEDSYIRARVFDMLIGDWDRHGDQWRWAEIEEENGNRIFKPIPRDRDQVFSNFDGALFNTLRSFLGFANQFAVYGEDIEDVKWFNVAATALDRSILQNSGREEWIAQTEFIQENITDEVIERAFLELPEDTRGESTNNLIEKVKARRDKLLTITTRYYDYLSNLAIVTGTDKDDFIDITRMQGGKTKIKISRNKGGQRAEILSEKIYSQEQTEEIWVYGLDDDDRFYVDGQGEDEILIRLIGGQNNDIYNVENGNSIKIYDHKSKPNTIEVNKGAKIMLTDDYEVNLYDKNRNITRTNAILPSIGYNPDDGVILGITNTYTITKFIRNPFTARHSISAGYFSATQGFEGAYEGEFANVIGSFNFGLRAYFSSPKNTRNFFGFGNESVNQDDALSWDYNRTRISRLGAEAGFVRESPFGSYFSYMATFEGVKVEDTEGRVLLEEFTTDPSFYNRKYFAGLEGTYRYESYDDILNPTNGMVFQLTGGTKMNVEETSNTIAYLDPYLEFYNALTRNRKWVLNTHIQAQMIFGDNYEFYQAATLGGNTGLRGFRHERFAGKQALATGADLRYSLDSFKTTFLPFQIGLFAGYDVGRVWAPGMESNIWHDSYGGGFWINSAEAFGGKLNVFNSKEGWRVSVEFRLRF